MIKVPDHDGFVTQQSTDKIGDLSVDNREFCLQMCTKPTIWLPVLLWVSYYQLLSFEIENLRF